MNPTLTVLAASRDIEARWARKLEEALIGLIPAKVQVASQTGEHGQLVFVDGEMPDLEGAIRQIDRKGRAVFVIVEEGAVQTDGISEALVEGKIDDVLLAPLRPLEVLSKLQRYQQILMWDEVTKLNASFAEILDRLHDDLRLAERMQKARLPSRFPQTKGFRASHRYFAGLKSGGDHLDLAESKDGSRLSLVLSDSSSYGLSSAVLSVLVRVAMKLTTEETRSSYDTVQRIREEILLTLGEKDRLSLFYGVISRKDYVLRYLNLGSSCAYYARPGGEFEPLPSQGEAIGKASKSLDPASVPEGQVALDPEGRLVLLSDGFADAAGGQEGTLRLLNRFRSKDASDTLNELAFSVKSKFTEEDDIPPQDCTALVMDVESRVLRLAPGGGQGQKDQG